MLFFTSSTKRTDLSLTAEAIKNHKSQIKNILTERLLQFIWQYQYFNRENLLLTNGDSLDIIHPGQLNTNQGPDFTEARIRINNTVWIGNIELHIKEEDWNRHSHAVDPNYQNVILHVIWEEKDCKTGLPTLCLGDRVAKTLLKRYEQLMIDPSFVPCANSIKEVPALSWTNWKERILIERLQHKTKLINEYLAQSNHHWEELFWWMLARNYGIRVNADAFEAIARSLPLTVLAKHKNQLNQLEALLFGQAGMLFRKFDEQYPEMLRKEYIFLKRKYNLRQISLPIHLLRMRPQNFPTVRLAQLAMMINQSSHLFSGIREMDSIADLRKVLSVVANDYWHYHYLFDQPSSFKPKKLGEEMITNIIINTIVPVLFAYGMHNKNENYVQKALQWLSELPAENNLIIRNWELLGVKVKAASDTQALIELKSAYCDVKRCLECAVGGWIMKGER